jgi:hypothetical protein
MRSLSHVQYVEKESVIIIAVFVHFVRMLLVMRNIIRPMVYLISEFLTGMRDQGTFGLKIQQENVRNAVGV